MIHQVIVAFGLLAIVCLSYAAPTKNSFNFAGVSKTVSGKNWKNCSGSVSYKTFSMSPLKPLCVDAKNVKITNLKCKSPQITAGAYPIDMKDVPVSYGGYNGLFSGTGQFDVKENGVGTVDVDKATVCKAL